MKPFISITLALIVLFSTIGMAKTTHFCMGNEMKSEIGFGKKHLDCGMNMPMDHSENEPDNQQDSQSCCENVTEHIQVDEEVQVKKLDIKLELNYTVALIHIFVLGTDFFTAESQELPQYTSPPSPQDLHVLYETFLI